MTDNTAPPETIVATTSDGTTSATVKRSGRPVIGAIAGFLFGVFLAIDLVALGLVRFESLLVLLIPLTGLVAGIALALWAPFGAQTE